MSMKEFNFDDFQEAWDKQEKVLNQMKLVHEDEVKKMMEEAPEKESEEHKLLLHKGSRKQWIWRCTVAACIISVIATTLVTVVSTNSISKSQIGISQDIYSQADEQQPTPYQNYGDMEQTELQGLSTTGTNELGTASMQDENRNGSLSSAEAGRHESEVMIKYPTQDILSTESGVTLEVTPEAYQLKPAKNVKNYGHEAYVMSNRKCNAEQIINQLQQIL